MGRGFIRAGGALASQGRSSFETSLLECINTSTCTHPSLASHSQTYVQRSLGIVTMHEAANTFMRSARANMPYASYLTPSPLIQTPLSTHATY